MLFPCSTFDDSRIFTARSAEVRTSHSDSYFSGNACFCPGPWAQLDTGKITGLKATWDLSGQKLNIDIFSVKD